MAILDGLVVFVMLQEMYISCYMHEIPLKICITTQVNHKIVGPKTVFFLGDFKNISKYHNKRNVAITSVSFPFLFEVIFKSSTTYIDISPRERHFWLVTILHPFEVKILDHISFLMMSSSIMKTEKSNIS